MFYSRPTYNRRQDVRFGLPHIHVLNRCPSSTEDARHILMYLFPRQYGLHNVFTSEVNRQETTQPFQDYTLREQEIQASIKKRQGKEPPVPRRLKGNILALVMQMQKLHQKCSYHALVKYYCPTPLCDPTVRNKVKPSAILPKNDVLETQEKVPSSPTETTGATADGSRDSQSNCERFTEFASSSGEVSGFVRAVIGRVIPNNFFGSGEANKNSVMRIIDRFVKLRRYESLSLHEALQGLKVRQIPFMSDSMVLMLPVDGFWLASAPVNTARRQDVKNRRS
ncbi:hypothetical protein K440DRAFT_360376 [Wilcoxina mikolae CBS 423.85]|nr:hypothetical protein K440DRAFT_360376 [Wilcoxina mikolae CBS 423.85]